MSSLVRLSGLSLGVCVTAAWPVAAQLLQPVDTRVDGRVLDANNQLGSGGFNAPQSSFYPNAANLFITGNVTGGRAFQGFSPIRDSSSLFLSLPTAQLGSFQRDSIGVGDVTAGRSPALASSFYLPSSTTTSVGGVGLMRAQPGTGGGGAVFAVPRVDLFTGRSLNVEASLNPGASAPSAGNLDPRFLPRSPVTTTPPPGSEVFAMPGSSEGGFLGLPRALGSDRPDLSRAGLPGYTAYLPGTLPGSAGATSPAETTYRSPILERLFQTGASTAPGEVAPSLFGRPDPGNLSSGGLSALRAAGGAPGGPGLSGPGASGTVPPRTLPGGGTPESGAPSQFETGQPMAVDPNAEPGSISFPTFMPTRQSLYQDFRRALQWSQAYPELGGTGAKSGGAEGEGTEATAPVTRFDPGVSYLQQLLNQAPQSFAGEVETDLNVRVRRAEALLRQGEFYNAAAQYAIAGTLAPDDPLMELGQGQAYLAAGDYLSALYHLTRGLERFPEVGRFQLDLYDFVSDPTILDIRRADLENKLEKQEDYRLRFLLGYAEYYGGLQKFGWQHLQRAAEEAPADSIIARLPRILRSTPPSEPPAQNRGR